MSLRRELRRTLSRTVGDLVFRRRGDEVVITRKPDTEGREWSEAQLAHRVLRLSLRLNHIWKTSPTLSVPQIMFREIGKKSSAHYKVLAVYRGEEKPTRRVKARELLRLLV